MQPLRRGQSTAENRAVRPRGRQKAFQGNRGQLTAERQRAIANPLITRSVNELQFA